MGTNGARYDPVQFRLRKCLGCGGLKFTVENHGNLAQDRLAPSHHLWVDVKPQTVCVHCRRVYNMDEKEPEAQEIAKPVSVGERFREPDACSHKWGSETQPDGSRVCLACGEQRK